MMGAGGFIKNPGWEMYSDEVVVDEDDVLFEVNSDLDIDPDLLVYFPPWSDEDVYSDDDLDDPDDSDYEFSDHTDSTADFEDDEELDNSMEEDEEDSDDEVVFPENVEDDVDLGLVIDKSEELSEVEEGNDST